jgi:thiol-disulfide isomerase/thioredoxin
MQKPGTHRVLAQALSGAVLLAAALAPAPRAANPAPAPSLYDLHDRPLSLDAYRGKVVVLDFWAPWCGPCRKSFPFLDGLQAKYGAQGLVVIGLTLEEDLDAVEAFLDAVPVRFTIARDPSQRAGETFGIVAMPTTLLLDRDGRVVARFEGGSGRVHDQTESAVRKLLAGGTLPAGTDVRVASSLEASGALRAWDRGYLADPIMNLDGDPLTRALRDHVHASKEGAAGDGGASGGGCGCN